MLYSMRKVAYLLCILGFCVNVYAAGEQRYIVVFKDHHKKRAAGTKQACDSARHFNIVPALAARLTAEQVRTFQEDPDVAFVELDYLIHAKGFAVSNASSWEASCLTQTIPYGVGLIGAASVWPKTKGAGAAVAVLDTGINLYHPDRGNIIASASFVTGEGIDDLDGHGTHTSGTVAAADNDIGVVGVAPEADLLIGKVLDNEGNGYTSWLIAGIEWAVQNGADVISMSLGGTDDSAALETACNAAYNAGVLLVAAAGNDSTDIPDYPAAYHSVVSVAAVDANKDIAYFSNFGETVELSAPGVSVLSTVPLADDAVGDAIWENTSHQSNVVEGTAAGTVTGQICDCGKATGLDPDNTCPDEVAGNIALIRRGDNTFAQKVDHARNKGAIGVMIANNESGNFLGTLNGASPLVVVSISQEDGDALTPLVESGMTGTVTVSGTLYAYYSGTSMATPHVAGAAALIFAAQGGDISASEVRSLLADTAEDLGDAGRDEIFGYGLVDVGAVFSIMTPANCQAAWLLGYGYPSDINRDCYLDLNDLILLASDWLRDDCGPANQWCGRTDIDQNASVSLSDYRAIAADWLTCNDPEDAGCTPNWP